MTEAEAKDARSWRAWHWQDEERSSTSARRRGGVPPRLSGTKEEPRPVVISHGPFRKKKRFLIYSYCSFSQPSNTGDGLASAIYPVRVPLPGVDHAKQKPDQEGGRVTGHTAPLKSSLFDSSPSPRPTRAGPRSSLAPARRRFARHQVIHLASSTKRSRAGIPSAGRQATDRSMHHPGTVSQGVAAASRTSPFHHRHPGGCPWRAISFRRWAGTTRSRGTYATRASTADDRLRRFRAECIAAPSASRSPRSMNWPTPWFATQVTARARGTAGSKKHDVGERWVGGEYPLSPAPGRKRNCPCRPAG